MLRLENFSFQFDTAFVLSNVTFCLPKGGYLSIIGPNGSGKSTLLKCLMKLHDQGQQKGKVFVKGQSLSLYTQRKAAQIMAYVPQAGGWIPPFTVMEFLKLSRYPHRDAWGGMTEADTKSVNKALCLTGTLSLAHRSLRSLSGGERQKVFLAAAIAQETEIMLLDEPDSFLDPKHAFEMKELMTMLNREQGITMVTVTHDLNHPFAVGGLVLALRHGQQFFFGTGQELLEQGIIENVYDHRFIRLKHPHTGLPVVLAE